MIKAVIWDIDGTMFDTERLQVKSWIELLTLKGYEVFEDVLHRMIGRTSEASNLVMIEKYGADFPAQKLREEKNLIFDRHLAQGIPLKPGVTEVLEWLSAHGIPSAAASATIHEKIVDRFTKTDLLKYFTVMVGGDEVTHGKPHPETFLTAAKRLGVDPSDCLVFEDSHNGVIAAHEAGMHVIMIPDLVAPTPELLKRVKHELGSLEEALPILINVFEK